MLKSVNTPLLQITNATASKTEAARFRALNFTLEAGQHWAITGYPEEAKQLFLEILAGKVSITHGVLHHHYATDYLGQPTDGIYRSHLDLVCLVPFHHHIRSKSNLQNFYYQQRFNSIDADDAATVAEYLQGIKPKNPTTTWRTEDAMALFGLDPFADKSIIKLSNGETRRLMLAAALARNPELLLLEHPLVGLDVGARARFNTILEQIIGSGIHVVMTSSPHEIPAAITHVAVVNEHGIVRQGFRNEVELPVAPTGETGTSLPIGLRETLTDLLVDSAAVTVAPIIEMNNVNVAYGDKVVLKDINWLVQPGEAWVLRGPNGAGKSTLLSLINGDNPQAYKNDITLFGRKRGTGESIWDIKKHIGYVSPELHQYFPKNQTVLQVVLSGWFDTVGLFRKVSAKQHESALQWLRLFGLADLARQRLVQLSPAQQRLALLARAVIKNPTLLILDEPCQGLSPQHREFFKALVDEIHQASDTTVIYVSHYEEDIPSCVTKSITLAHGSIAEMTD